MTDIDLTRRLADLSALNFSEDELIKINGDMINIISLMDKVKDFSAENTENMQRSVDYISLRKDEQLPSSSCKDITANSKNTESNCFVVPKTV